MLFWQFCHWGKKQNTKRRILEHRTQGHDYRFSKTYSRISVLVPTAVLQATQSDNIQNQVGSCYQGTLVVAEVQEIPPSLFTMRLSKWAIQNVIQMYQMNESAVEIELADIRNRVLERVDNVNGATQPQVLGAAVTQCICTDHTLRHPIPEWAYSLDRGGTMRVRSGGVGHGWRPAGPGVEQRSCQSRTYPLPGPACGFHSSSEYGRREETKGGGAVSRMRRQTDAIDRLSWGVKALHGYSAAGHV